MRDFPAELMDLVFDNLHPEPWHKGLDADYNGQIPGKPDLRACSLVSRSWSMLARRHLFRNVVYSFKCEPTADTSLLDVDQYQPYGKWSPQISVRLKTFAMFCTFLRDRPDIRPYIVRLKLDAFPSIFWTSLSDGTYAREDAVNLSLFCELIQSLPRLDTLRLYNIVLDSRPAILPALRPSLDYLCVSYCTQNGVEPSSYRSWSKRKEDEIMADILECFAKTKELHLLDCFGDVRMQDGKPVECSIEVESLILEDLSDTLPLIQYMAGGNKISNLRKLTLEARPAMQSSSLLAAVGSHLEELVYVVRFGTYDIPLDLKHYTNLRSLTLGLHFDTGIEFGVAHTLRELNRAFTFPGRVNQYLPRFEEIVIHIDLEHSTIELEDLSLDDEDLELLQLLQGALLNIVEQRSLSGIWIECRPFSKDVQETRMREVIEDIFGTLTDSGKLLWREKRNNEWPLLCVTSDLFVTSL